MGKDKRPAFQFYYKDWLSDSALKRRSRAAKGLWIDLLCMMFDSEERGFLIENGVVLTPGDVLDSMEGNRDVNRSALKELLSYGIARRDDRGAIYSKRMVEDERVRQIHAECGCKGGRPKVKTKTEPNAKPKGKAKPNQTGADADADAEELNCIEEGDTGGKPKPARPADPIWDSLCSLFSLKPVTRGERSRIGQCVRDLKAKSATVPQVEAAWSYCRDRFDPFGPECLVKWFDQAQHPGTGKPAAKLDEGEQAKARARQLLREFKT